MACGFIPIANYVIFGIVLIAIIVALCDDVLSLRDKPFKSEKFRNWLMKSWEVMDKETPNCPEQQEENYNSKHDFPGDNMVEEWAN